MANPSWAFTGQQAEDVLTTAAKEQEIRYEESKKARRFWVVLGETKSITFVDGIKHPKGYDLPFMFMEHDITLYIGGNKQRKQFTCLGKDCPMCTQGNKPYLAQACTIIDHTGYTSKKDGKAHKDEVVLFVAKITVQGILKKYREKKKSLRGLKFDVSRSGGQAASTGDQFFFDDQVELDTSIQPLDYFEIFAPKPVDYIHKILSGTNPSSFVGYDEPASVSDSAPVDEDAPIRF